MTTHDLCSGLVRAGHEVHLLTRGYHGKKQSIDSSIEQGLSIHRIHAQPGKWNNVLFFIRLTAAAFALKRKVDFQIVHAPGTIPGLVASILKLILRTPHIQSFHQDQLIAWKTGADLVITPSSRLSLVAQKFIAYASDRVLVQSQLVGEIVREVLNIKHESKIKVVPNPVLVTDRPVGPSNTGIDPTILSVSTLTRRKGLDLLLDAMPKVIEEFPRATLMVVGGGPLENRLKSKVTDLDIQNSVSFLGWREGDELVDCYDRATLFVLPSYAEVFGRVIVEAMSRGKPVVATKTIGASSIVVNNETGILTKIGSSGGIADAIISVLGTQGMVEKMGAEARKRATLTFGLKRIVGLIEDQYRDVLD